MPVYYDNKNIATIRYNDINIVAGYYNNNLVFSSATGRKWGTVQLPDSTDAIGHTHVPSYIWFNSSTAKWYLQYYYSISMSTYEYRIYSSSDLTTWTLFCTMPTKFYPITANNNLLVGIVNTNYSYCYIGYSLDNGATVNTITDFEIDTSYNSIKYANGIFYANANTTSTSWYKIIYSTDGISWSECSGITINKYTICINVIYYNSIYYMLCGDSGSSSSSVSYIYSSTDGKSWSKISSINSGSNSAVGLLSAGNKLFISFSTTATNMLYYSTDNGNTWSIATINNNVYLGGGNAFCYGNIIYNKGLYVLGAYKSSGSNFLYYSDDGINWTSGDTSAIESIYGTTSFVYDLEYNDNTYVANTFKGLIYSADGKVWYPTGINDSGGLIGRCNIVYYNKRWVTGTNFAPGCIVYSKPGMV